MTVYVDDMRAKYGRMIMCHMLADSDEELHAMATKIGVQRKWWQSPEVSSGSHYDIALSKRNVAVYYGAVEITQRQAAAMNARRRQTGRLGPPEEAEEWLQKFFAMRNAKKPASKKPPKQLDLNRVRHQMAWGVADNESVGLSQSKWYDLCSTLVTEIERLRAELSGKSRG